MQFPEVSLSFFLDSGCITNIQQDSVMRHLFTKMPWIQISKIALSGDFGNRHNADCVLLSTCFRLSCGPCAVHQCSL